MDITGQQWTELDNKWRVPRISENVPTIGLSRSLVRGDAVSYQSQRSLSLRKQHVQRIGPPRTGTVLIVLNPVKSWRHFAVGSSLVIAPGLVALGLLGGGIHEERDEAKQIVVAPDGNGGIRITEIADADFGTTERHGYQRIIPNDFGEPTDIVVRAPHASDKVYVNPDSYQTTIRIGDPNITYTGQHRYELAFTLPNARIDTGQLALDLYDGQTDYSTGRLEIVVTGFELTDPLCNTGDYGDVGGCELVREGDVYRAVIEPLPPHQYVTIGGTITAFPEPATVAAPPLPTRREDHSTEWALGLGALGALAAGGGFVTAQRLGRNQVAGSNAADAAYAAGSAHLVSDAALDDMATTEFEAPRGIRPWQGNMLLTEKVGFATVSAWFSDLIAQEYLTLSGSSPQMLSAGPNAEKAPPALYDDIKKLFDVKGELQMGKYQPKLASLWSRVLKDQTKEAASSGWWTKFPPGTRARYPKLLTGVVVIAIAVLLISVMQHWLRAWPAAIAAAIAIPAMLAGKVYRPLLPVRSAEGSALALRAESFRRFLQASEGKHVDWAWKNGLLREYSAWAVALGAADAWGRAIANSTVPPPEAALQSMPILVHTNSTDWSRSHTRITTSSSSGSHSSSSFSGGFSGGGGGGGSSSHW